MRNLIFAASVAAIVALPAYAQQQPDKSSPQTGKKPSEILSLIEARPDFARLDEMSWSDRGYYEIQYRTNDKARVEINIDAGGKPVDQE
ncbi:PepSY domain-containing protein [Shinella sp. BE166]|uniref:PepSY domain-containing protein n=1 Tax=unclassified Shinella TaxID=2643062 RepID=UPI003EBC57B8